MQIVTAVDGEFYVGLNAMYETHEQTWDIFLMTSRDGFDWNWVDRKLPFLGRSEYPGYDAGYMAPSGPIFQGSRLRVDLDAGLPMQEPRVPPRYDECEVRAALEDQSGGHIEGFTLDRSTVLGSSGVQEITWAGADIGRLAGKPVRIRFEMHSAALYSIQFVP
jgi:hypothetical protein